ncbi:MAG: hypothetical protein K2M17_04200 [Bacilli bacterium]|nr:hypothetical protein [Bacilli bacterium]
MKIIPKEEKKLSIDTGDVIKAIDEWGKAKYFLVVEPVHSANEPRVYGMVPLSDTDKVSCGVLTTDGNVDCDTDSFLNNADDLIDELEAACYTDIQKVTLEAREV